MGIFQKIKKIFIDSFLPIFAGVVLISGIIYAWNEPTAPPPSGSGVLTISQGNVGIGTANPTTLKGTSGYLDVKDVFMRDVGRWASDTGSCICRLGNSLQLAINCGSSWQDLYSSGGVPIAYFRCSQNVAQFGSYLVNAAHTEDNCTTAGGTIQIDGANKFCKFTDSACPTGWTQYNNWSATSAKTCTGTTNNTTQCPVGSCATASHTFNNTARESCSYTSSRSWISQSCCSGYNPIVCSTCCYYYYWYSDCSVPIRYGWGYGYDSCAGAGCCDAYPNYCSSGYTGGDCSSYYDCSYCSDSSATCYADTTAIGCY